MSQFAPIETDAGFQVGRSPDEVPSHAADDADQVMRLDQRIVVVGLTRKLEALFRNFQSLVLVATHEMERAQSPQRAKLTRCVADLPAQFSGATEGLRGLQCTPAAYRNQRISEIDLQCELGLVALALVR